MMPAPLLKRVYEAPSDADGLRVLVDRLWPRGLSKDKAKVDLWLKDLAPSDELRRDLHAHPDHWAGFRKAYRAELADNAALDELKALAKRRSLTLLFAARDQEHNTAVVLKTLL